MTIFELESIIDDLVHALGKLHFKPPISHVYNPLEYARLPYSEYQKRYSGGKKEAILLGMNPGPWGMAQTGIPFGEVQTARKWLGIKSDVEQPSSVHPKRPVLGYSCKRREVSGKRLWGWAQNYFKTPDRFFERFFVANYCPLLFIDADGRNRTPNQIRMRERKPLLEICDRALRQTVASMNPDYVVGVGRFAEERAQVALKGLDIKIGGITHPSPANPKANRGWEAAIMTELAELGIRV